MCTLIIENYKILEKLKYEKTKKKKKRRKLNTLQACLDEGKKKRKSLYCGQLYPFAHHRNRP